VSSARLARPNATVAAAPRRIDVRFLLGEGLCD
jgi:hypothetical protein